MLGVGSNISTSKTKGKMGVVLMEKQAGVSPGHSVRSWSTSTSKKSIPDSSGDPSTVQEKSPCIYIWPSHKLVPPLTTFPSALVLALLCQLSRAARAASRARVSADAVEAAALRLYSRLEANTDCTTPGRREVCHIEYYIFNTRQ